MTKQEGKAVQALCSYLFSTQAEWPISEAEARRALAGLADRSGRPRNYDGTDGREILRLWPLGNSWLSRKGE